MVIDPVPPARGLRATPFHSRVSALCESRAWRPWAGYAAVRSYELTHDREYHAIRNAAGLLDVTPLYKYSIQGRDAARLLDRVVTRDVAGSAVHQVLYTPWCDAGGKVLDDGTVTRLAPDRFRLTSADPNLRWLEMNAVGMEVEIEDVSEALAALALQGPNSRAILEEAAESDLGGLKFFRHAAASFRGAPVEITRTGYTGDLGYELWLDPADAEGVWDALMEVGGAYGITPAGLDALDLARIEAGLILLDVDYLSARKAVIPGQYSSPYELGLGWTVQLEKETFVGREALEKEAAREAEWRFVGIEVDWESLERRYSEAGLAPHLPTAAWRSSVPLYRSGRQVGYATSGCWSPLLKRYVALAHLTSPSAQAGTRLEMEITVEHRRRAASARVARTPFFDPPRKRR